MSGDNDSSLAHMYDDPMRVRGSFYMPSGFDQLAIARSGKKDKEQKRAQRQSIERINL